MGYRFIPYKAIGGLTFGMTNNEVKKELGEPTSSLPYGYPDKVGLQEQYHNCTIDTFCHNQKNLECVWYTFGDDLGIEIEYENTVIKLTPDVNECVNALKEVCDDLTLLSDGYSSAKLGIGVYCSEDNVDLIAFCSKDNFEECWTV